MTDPSDKTDRRMASAWRGAAGDEGVLDDAWRRGVMDDVRARAAECDAVVDEGPADLEVLVRNAFFVSAAAAAITVAVVTLGGMDPVGQLSRIIELDPQSLITLAFLL